MSISVMTSISEQNESRSLDNDCPDYDAVVNKRQDLECFFPIGNFTFVSDSCLFKHSFNAHYSSSLDDSRTSLPRSFKGMSMTSGGYMSSDVSKRSPRPLPRHERYIYTYRLIANGAPLHFLISCAKIFFCFLTSGSYPNSSPVLNPTPADQYRANILSTFA